MELFETESTLKAIPASLKEGDAAEDLGTLRLSLSALAEDILSRSAQLLDELQHFEDLRQSLQKHAIPGISGLVQVARKEQKSAQQVLQSLQSSSLTPEHAQKLGRIKFSNLPAHERDWNAIKRCRGLASISQTFICPTAKSKRRKEGQKKGKPEEEPVFVDASVDGGAEWLRIVSVDERRLLFEMADNGWDWGAEDEASDNESSASGSSHEDDEDGISLVRIVKGLVHTSRVSWHNYRHPRVHLLLTRLDEGSNHETDRLLHILRSMGGGDVEVVVDCANSDYNRKPVPPLETALSNLLKDDLGVLSDTLVIDTSILIALASDVSHSRVEVQKWHRSDLKAQIQEEADGRSFLLSNAYPVLRSKKLVCTQLAAKHYREIVTTIGTETENARAAILLPPDAANDNTPSHESLAEFQKLSIHPAPEDLRLPVRILDEKADVDIEAAIAAGALPAVARVVESELLDLSSNRATFLYGWISGNSVVTSNNNLVKRMVRLIESGRASDQESGPKTWVFPFNRALSTKGKPHDFDMANSRRIKKGKSST